MMKYRFLLLAVAAALSFGCSSEKKETEPDKPVVDEYDVINVTTDPHQYEWKNGDAVTVIGYNAEKYDIQSGFTSSKAVFRGKHVDGSNYRIICPGSYSSEKMLLARDYRVQTQIGNANTDHLQYNAMIFGVKSYSDVSFTSEWAATAGAVLKQNGIIRIEIGMPDEVKSVSSVIISSTAGVFYTSNKADDIAGSLKLNLEGIDLTGADAKLQACLNVSFPAVEVETGSSFTIILSTDAGEYEKVFKAESNLVIGDGHVVSFSLSKDQWNNSSGGSLSDFEGVKLFEDKNEVPGDAKYKFLFIGNSFTQDAVWHLPEMFDNMGVDNVKMVDNYIGGHLIPEYNSEFTTGTSNNAYTYTPQCQTWVNQTGMTLEQICMSDDWDVITFQEHTGNHCAWIFDEAEKSAIKSLVSKVKATQTKKTPKVYWLMSQSYYDFARMSGQMNYWTFNTQRAMYDVCVEFAKKVMADIGFDGIIPTGTYLQNIRTSSVNSPMDMTRDGYHMDYGLARYGAACTVYEACLKPVLKKELGKDYMVSDGNPSSTGHRTPITMENAAVARRAASLAVSNPYEITDMGGRTTHGGISTAYELVDFALAVNNGESIDRFKDPEGKIVLKNDIDMSSVRVWIPIGRTVMSWPDKSLKVSIGHPFTGHFDGQGHSIKNLRMVCDNNINYRSWGLFGCVANGGIVENLVIDSSCSISVCPDNQTEFGVVAGVVLDGIVRNVVNNADVSIIKMPATPDNARLSVGLVGFAYASNGALLEGIVNNGRILTTVNSDSNYYYCGGIVGLVTNSKTAAGSLIVKNCVSAGDIVATQGNPIAGIVSNVDRPDISFIGCKSTGRIVTDRAMSKKLMGTFFGNCVNQTVFSDCVCSAKLAAYNNGNWNYYSINADNYLNYVGAYSSTTGVDAIRIRFYENE